MASSFNGHGRDSHVYVGVQYDSRPPNQPNSPANMMAHTCRFFLFFFWVVRIDLDTPVPRKPSLSHSSADVPPLPSRQPGSAHRGRSTAGAPFGSRAQTSLHDFALAPSQTVLLGRTLGRSGDPPPPPPFVFLVFFFRVGRTHPPPQQQKAKAFSLNLTTPKRFINCGTECNAVYNRSTRRLFFSFFG